MRMLTKKERPEEKNHHDFPATRSEYAEQYPLVSRFLEADARRKVNPASAHRALFEAFGRKEPES